MLVKTSGSERHGKRRRMEDGWMDGLVVEERCVVGKWVVVKADRLSLIKESRGRSDPCMSNCRNVKKNTGMTETTYQ